MEKLPEPHRGRALNVLRQRIGEAAALVAMNGYYAAFMAEYLRVPTSGIHVVPPGVNLAGHGTRRSRPGPLTIGYFARVCPDKGLHRLAAALPLLAADASVPPVQVWAAGYLDAADRPYFVEIRQQIAAAGLKDRFFYVGTLDRAGQDRLLAIARLVLPADRVPREQGALGVRGLGQRRTRRPAGPRGFPGDGRGHGRRSARGAERSGRAGGRAETHALRCPFCRRVRPAGPTRRARAV